MIYSYDIVTMVMDRKTKSIIKIAVPIVIVMQLTAILFSLNKDKALSCKAVGDYFVCKQIKLK